MLHLDVERKIFCNEKELFLKQLEIMKCKITASAQKNEDKSLIFEVLSSSTFASFIIKKLKFCSQETSKSE
jgi:hypothetical protein